jgi:hypothetical protein
MTIDDPAAPAAAFSPYQEIASVDLKGDRLVEILNPFSDVFFAPIASPDIGWAKSLA